MGSHNLVSSELSGISLETHCTSLVGELTTLSNADDFREVSQGASTIFPGNDPRTTNSAQDSNVLLDSFDLDIGDSSPSIGSSSASTLLYPPTHNNSFASFQSLDVSRRSNSCTSRKSIIKPQKMSDSNDNNSRTHDENPIIWCADQNACESESWQQESASDCFELCVDEKQLDTDDYKPSSSLLVGPQVHHPSVLKTSPEAGCEGTLYTALVRWPEGGSRPSPIRGLLFFGHGNVCDIPLHYVGDHIYQLDTQVPPLVLERDGLMDNSIAPKSGVEVTVQLVLDSYCIDFGKFSYLDSNSALSNQRYVDYQQVIERSSATANQVQYPHASTSRPYSIDQDPYLWRSAQYRDTSQQAQGYEHGPIFNTWPAFVSPETDRFSLQAHRQQSQHGNEQQQAEEDLIQEQEQQQLLIQYPQVTLIQIQQQQQQQHQQLIQYQQQSTLTNRVLQEQPGFASLYSNHSHQVKNHYSLIDVNYARGPQITNYDFQRGVPDPVSDWSAIHESNESNVPPTPRGLHRDVTQGDHRKLLRKLSPSSPVMTTEIESAMKQWTAQELNQRRRLISFSREIRNDDLLVSFRSVAFEDYTPNVPCVSCIISKVPPDAYYITSVDCIFLLEQLSGTRFDVEEKNRIRRNLEGCHPQTVSRSHPETEDLFRLIMGFPAPRPRNIEKDVKVFEWQHLVRALSKVIEKYGIDSTTNTLQRMPNNR